MSSYFDNKELFSSPTVSQFNNHMVMTNVNKKTKTKYINIDTKFCDEYVNNRTNPSNPSYNISNYTVTLPDRINDVKSISVVNIELPVSYYNISSALGNNYFYVISGVEGFIPVMVTLPDGQYDANSLNNSMNAAIQFSFSQVNSQGYELTFEINSINKSMFYSQPGNTFTIDFAVDKNGQFDKYNFKSKLGWLLGFRNTSYVINGTSYEDSIQYTYSESIINLNPYTYFYLTIDEFSKSNQNSFTSAVFHSSINKNIIAKVILNQQIYPFGSVFPANTHFGFLMSDTRTYNGKVDIQKLNIQLVDDTGRTVNLNGIDFSFGLQIEYE